MSEAIKGPLLGAAAGVATYLALQKSKVLGKGKGPSEVSYKAPQYFVENKYPAKEHNRVVKSKMAERDTPVGFVLAGNVVEPVKYCDGQKPFRQERYFYYLSGCDIPGSVIFFDGAQERLVLFIPDVDEESVVWSGLPATPKECMERYDVDDVMYVSELPKMLERDASGLELFTTDFDVLGCVIGDQRGRIAAGSNEFFDAMDEARLIKDEYEIETLRHISKMTDYCHYSVMSALPIEQNELQLEAEFRYHSHRQGAKGSGYDPICGSGSACGTLHYVTNNQELAGKDSVLVDAGCEWRNYTSDVTRCFPLTGRFTREHRAVYDAVLDMQTQTMALMSPGASWEELHLLSHRVLIKHLLKMGVLRAGHTEEQLLESRVSCGFYPHGLGHLLGLDVHDVGGHANYEDTDPLFKNLRLRRTLQTGMVVTNEPGCYFNEHLLDEFVRPFPERAQLVDFTVVERYMRVGGVRIEDDVLITKEGHENLTGITSNPEEIEQIVANGSA